MSVRLAMFFAAGMITASANVWAADGDLVTKAALAPKVSQPVAASGPETCTGVSELVLTNCVLSRYGVTFYGTVDVGVGYQTHGLPASDYFPQGLSYLTQKYNREPLWQLAPSPLGTSNIGFRGAYNIASDVKFIFQVEAGFNPYTFKLLDGPKSVLENVGRPLNQQTAYGDSARAGQLYNSLGFLGFATPAYGALTFFRQTALSSDTMFAYDPLASTAFSGLAVTTSTTGAGVPRTQRSNTAIKYKIEQNGIRAGLYYQVGGYEYGNGSNGIVQTQIGADFRNFGPGILSIDGIYSYAKDAFIIGNGGGTVSPDGTPLTFPPQALGATISNNTAWIGVAKYAIGDLSLFAGYEFLKYGAPSQVATRLEIEDNIWFNTTATSGTAYSGLPGSGRSKHVQIMWIGGRYALTPDVDIAAGVYHYIQNDFFVATATANCSIPTARTQCAGTMNTAAALIKWRFAPKWETYFGIQYSELNGGYASGAMARNNLDPTVGLRFRF